MSTLPPNEWSQRASYLAQVTITDLVHADFAPGEITHVETDGRSTNLINEPQFAVPEDIVPDLPLKTTADVRALLAKAVVLCRPRPAGFELGGQGRQELKELARSCRFLALARSHEDDSAEAISDEQERVFDRFFGLTRSRSNDAFCIGIVWGIIAMLEEISHSNTLVPAEVGALTGGFCQISKPFLKNFDGEGTLNGGRKDEITPVRHPLERWRNGHLVFVALTDGLIFGHARAIAAIGSRDFDHAARALSDISSLFIASAAAMRLTGDMSTDDYELVRSIMGPPHVPEGFSGLFNSDHRHLLRLTKQLGTLFGGDLPELASARENYWMALSTAYNAHRSVCQKLVGCMPSLASASRGQERPAHEKLEGFAKRALLMAGYPKRLFAPGNEHVEGLGRLGPDQ